jgi:hypothetical protein
MKLYWRIKKDGKWTWVPAKVHADLEDGQFGSSKRLIVDKLVIE